jgi:hypothetical protein
MQMEAEKAWRMKQILTEWDREETTGEMGLRRGDGRLSNSVEETKIGS